MTTAIAAGGIVPSNKTQIQDGGALATLNITGSVVLKAAPGQLHTIIVTVVTAVASMTLIDSTGLTVSAANTILAIPSGTAANTIFVVDWPCLAGIAVVFGSGATGTLAISYD